MQYSNDEMWQMLLSENKSYPKKSPKELQSAVCILFENPISLVQRCMQMSRSKVSNYHSALDVDKIQNIYNSINHTNLNGILTKCLTKSLDEMPDQGHKQFDKLALKQYYFILILWQKLFSCNQNKQLLEKCLSRIARLNESFIDNLHDLTANHLTLIVCHLQQNLIAEFEKVLSATQEESISRKQNQELIHNYCIFLNMLNKSNNEFMRTPNEIFINPKISQYFQPIGQYKLHLKKIKQLNFLCFPFLLDLDYKYRMLQIQSIFEQKINMQKSLQSGLSGLLSGMIQTDINGNFSLQGLIYLHFQVNRHNILDDSMQKLCKVKQNLKSQMRISFVGQEGSDEGGVKNQYFQLVIRQIFNPYLDMFLPKNNGRVYWFNGYSFQPPIRFEFVGMLLGLAIYNSVHLDLHFPNLLYKKLLSLNQESEFSLQTIEDLKQIQPEIYRSFKALIDEKGSLEGTEMYFTVELSSFGEKIVQELVQDGHSIPVTQDNKVQYCQLYADYLINKHIAKQFTSFCKGFRRVVSGDMINIFKPHELRTIICGNQNIDFQELQAHTHYEGGYTEDTEVVKNLWNILHELTIEDKKAFLVFVTGTDRVPIDGLKSLGFVIQKHANTGNLPTSHTCFNVFLLPEYQTKSKLQKNIRVILKNNQGFGLI